MLWLLLVLVAAAGVQPDVAGVQPDVAGVQPDVAGVQPDVAGVQPDVAGVQPDVAGVQPNVAGLAADYYTHRGVKQVCYLSCSDQYQNAIMVKNLIHHDIRTSLATVTQARENLPTLLVQRIDPVGVFLDGACEGAQDVLDEASRGTLLDDNHMWLILQLDNSDYVQNFQNLNMSVDADVVIASCDGVRCRLTDLYNFGRVQGNAVETVHAGTWDHTGLHLALNSFKYYDRWNFHNLTLRAVSVVVNSTREFDPSILSDVRYSAGVSAMTKIVAQLLNVLMEQHNFRFNYTIASRWIGTPKRNSTLAVTNSLFWREQDISCTCLRIFPHWLNWMDVLHPPATTLETKFYYLIPNKGIGDYENRFLTPMSPGVWWTYCLAGGVCILVLAAAAFMESRAEPLLYALFSVLAAMCQQAYEDAQQLEERFSSQGRRMTLLVVGLMSMLLYNYYTSSVVSWLLNAAAPTIATIDGLINSDFELVFEDIGYTKSWLDNPGFYYYTGYKNPKEDELRDKKVTRARRTVPLLQSVEEGVDLVRKRGYAYHTEPYTASQMISRKFADRELCDLSSLQMMAPALVYIVAQKNSPYKEFFDWSLLRLLERGHTSVSRRRITGVPLECSGRTPRALALGQAAPAFLLLLHATMLCLFILSLEIFWHRMEMKKKQRAVAQS